MRHSPSFAVMIVLWSLVVRWLLVPLASLVAFFSDRVRDQLNGRPDVRELTIRLARERRKFEDCLVFFCSSAGEYEQAKPVIDRLAKSGRILCHVFFFSTSGDAFVKARKDSVSYSMAPPDDARAWGSIFGALQPSKTLIIRHELWPSFLWAASMWGPIVVVNAVVPSLFGRQAKWKESLNLAVKSRLFKMVDLICAVSRQDQEFFERWLAFPTERILVTGDTKYDRVVERAIQKKESVTGLRSFYREKWVPSGCDLLLIGGSVHLSDVDVVMRAVSQQSLGRVKVLLVPHDVSSSNVARIFDRVRQFDVGCELLSEIESAEFEFAGAHPRVIIVDKMGRLSELYGVADLAWVGGAAHAKVHNVLEPAVWGLPVSCGRHYQNSQEAVLLHGAGLLFVASDSDEFARYLDKSSGEIRDLGEKTGEFARRMAGASDLVVAAIARESLGSG